MLGVKDSRNVEAGNCLSLQATTCAGRLQNLFPFKSSLVFCYQQLLGMVLSDALVLAKAQLIRI